MEREAPEIPGYRFLGWGPQATGSNGGWAARPWYAGRCSRCGELLSMDPAESGQCKCGHLYKDADYGRFGSTDGDASIAVYEQMNYLDKAKG